MVGAAKHGELIDQMDQNLLLKMTVAISLRTKAVTREVEKICDKMSL